MSVCLDCGVPVEPELVACPDCAPARHLCELLSAFLDDELSGELQQAFTDHLEYCTRCRRDGGDFVIVDVGVAHALAAAAAAGGVACPKGGSDVV